MSKQIEGKLKGKIKVGATYEIPGDGNDDFTAEADAYCPHDGVWRVIIQTPQRWRGYWSFVPASEMKLARATGAA